MCVRESLCAHVCGYVSDCVWVCLRGRGVITVCVLIRVAPCVLLLLHALLFFHCFQNDSNAVSICCNNRDDSNEP